MPQVDDMVTLSFPRAGIDLSAAFDKQPNRPVDGQSDYARTCAVGINVRGFEGLTQRDRGGSRPGLAKYLPAALVAGWIVQDVNLLVGSGYPPPGATMQQSMSGRVVSIVAVSQGNLYVAGAGDTAWTSPTNNTGESPPLNYSGVLYSTACNQKLFFADGVNAVYYDPTTNIVQRWTLTAGTFPSDAKGNLPRLICTWRGRVVQSGLLFDPQNWFMSAVSDPFNYEYFPTANGVALITPTQAVAGNNSSLGLVGDVVTGLVPYSDDLLIFGGDHTLYQMQGDPMSGGQITLISDSIGMAWGQAWCKDPYGTVYFVSNKTGIYSMQPGQAPQRISQAIEQLLLDIDTGANGVRLIWDDRWQGLHVFITALAAPQANTHFFYELRTGAWWKETFGNTNHDPLCCCTFDGNLPGDRAVLIGSWDGYVRTISPTATDDDGTAISSSVLIGPLVTKDLDTILCKDLQAVLGATSGSVTYAVYVGTTAEIALSNSPVLTGTWTSGRNLLNLIRRSGHACYVKLTSTNRWAMETIRTRVQTQGKIQRRGP